MEDRNKSKFDFLSHLLSEGDAMVCLDARRDDVDVPHMHKKNPSLNLVLNLNFRRPVHVLMEGIQATLAFGGRPHSCYIPFDAVWALYEPGMKKGQVWEEDFPKDIDLSQHLQPTAPAPKAKTGAPQRLTSRPGSEIKGAKPKRDRSHLRVIK
ncbi:MAG: hypothetical protein COV67_14205 [Nitrospinae bacterium CG11_big_fil_rev_8_21_14_0_20_56_8]|nr:MAG: hypothetical protein COV67_14205 [Nitrospinae bacterium CG11_big_fil_rev_8_21_14_0_20_56_8]